MSVQPTRTVEPTSRAGVRLRDLFSYRELITNLVRKELRIKYKNSTLGFVWSLLNPALYLVIFWVVFTKFLGANVPNFPIYLLAGLLGWNLLSASLGGAVTSLLGNANLVTKVYFPREVLPIATIGASLMHFFFQLIVLLVALLAFRFSVSAEALLLVPAALVVLLLFLLGTCLGVAVLNVYFRDVGHLLELVLLAWFWMTPIVYPIAFVMQNLGTGTLLWRIYMLNPMTTVVLAFQRGIYGQVNAPDANGNLIRVLVEAPMAWYARNLAVLGVVSIILVAVGWWTFQRLESRLAEEL